MKNQQWSAIILFWVGGLLSLPVTASPGIRGEHRQGTKRSWSAHGQRCALPKAAPAQKVPWPGSDFPLRPYFRDLPGLSSAVQKKAIQQWRSGKVNGALKELQKAASKLPPARRSRLFLEVAHQLMSFADAPRALAYYRRLTQDKDLRIALPARLMIARHLLMQFRAKEAYQMVSPWPKKMKVAGLMRIWLAGWWVRGTAAMQSGKTKEASASYLFLIQRGAVIADAAAHQRVKIAMQQRQYVQAEKLAVLYLKKWPKSRVARDLRRIRAKALERRGKYRQALRHYTRMARGGDTSARLGAIRCQIKTGARKAAIQSLLRLLQQSPGRWIAQRAAKMLQQLGFRSTLPSIRYAIAYHQFRRGQFKQAAAGLAQVLRQLRQTSQAKLRPIWEPKALYLQSRALFRIKEYASADKGIQVFLRRYPRHRKRLAVALLQIRNRYRQRKDLATALLYERFAMKHSASPLGRKSLWWAAQLIFEHGKTKRATRLFRLYAQRYARTGRRSEALLKIALIAYQQKEYKAVGKILQPLRRQGGRFGARALFWSGKAQLKLGNQPGATRLLRKIKPFAESYYAARARQYTANRPILAKRPISLYRLLSDHNEERRHRASMRRWWKQQYPKQTMGAMVLRFQRSQAYRQAYVFALAGHTRAVRTALSARTRKPVHVAEIYLISRAWAAFGDPNRTLYTAGLFRQKLPRNRRKGLPFRAMLRLLYPVPYPALYMRYGKQYKIPPLLMVGLTRQESLFNPMIVSGAGARGIAQIMPKEGQKMARQWGIRNYRLQHLFRPQLNLRMGFHHFRVYLDKHKGHVALTLAAYNAGPGALKRWIKATPKLPKEDIEAFIEYGIGYRETRMYVRYCLRWYNMYRFAFAS